MTDDAILARCSIEHRADGPEPGHYYTIEASGEVSEPVGPFDTAAAAEEHFMEAIKQASILLMKKALGI